MNHFANFFFFLCNPSLHIHLQLLPVPATRCWDSRVELTFAEKEEATEPVVKKKAEGEWSDEEEEEDEDETARIDKLR